MSHAQSHDHIWLFGYPPNNQEEDFGGSMIDFNVEPPIVSFFEIPISFTTIAMISDPHGNLLAYSNGCEVINSAHEQMEGGDSINPGIIHDIFCELGYPDGQGAIFLPILANKYRLLHNSINPQGIISDLLYTDLQFEGIDNLGAVISKNMSAGNGPFAIGLTAVQHANGRDWWILEIGYESNIFHKFISDPQGVSLVDSQEIGDPLGRRDWSGQVAFSPDGDKFVRIDVSNGLRIFDFDRCSGDVSNPLLIEFPMDTVSSSGVAFSPNSRFLYVSVSTRVYQFDMWAANIDSSREVVAVYDGFVGPLSTTFFQQMLAPDGKIYITAPSSVKYLHVINNPNEKGTACDLVQHGVELPTLHAFSTPNFPHFGMGPVVGSPCDSLGTVSTTKSLSASSFKIYPNPSSGSFVVRIENSLIIDKGVYCELFNINGRFIRKIGLYSDGQVIDLDVPSGVYVLHIRDKSSVLGVKRLIVIK